MIFVALVFSGCSEKIAYVPEPYKVKVPVKCVVPETICDSNQDTYTEIIKEMRLCIERYKENAKVCQ